jgi:hypothetical protein
MLSASSFNIFGLSSSGPAALDGDKYKQIKHQVQKELRQSYWKYIENLVTPNEDGSSLNSMNKFSLVLKSTHRSSAELVLTFPVISL